MDPTYPHVAIRIIVVYKLHVRVCDVLVPLCYICAVHVMTYITQQHLVSAFPLPSIPPFTEHQEGTQVLHYVNGQKYDVHYDAFHDSVNSRRENGGQRVVTFLMYLSTPEEGGETVFPFANQKVSGPGWSECALQGFAHKPRRGDAMMFYRWVGSV